MITPEVSVVMSVYNGGDKLKDTIESILDQSFTNFEFIIINDGSTDNSSEILQGYQKTDPRILLINQDNKGLTKSLVLGCDRAKGKYIARQDVGDVSSRNRLETQKKVMEESKDISILSSVVRFETSVHEFLYHANLTQDEQRYGLKVDSIEKIKGPPHHGSVMFRREQYIKVGGYRWQFFFAQDIDLWLRLIRVGRHKVLDKCLYTATIDVGNISNINRKEQVFLAKLALASSKDKNEADEKWLSKAATIKKSEKYWLQKKIGYSAALYFIGSSLKRNNNPNWKTHMLKAIVQNPLNTRAWYGLFFSR